MNIKKYLCYGIVVCGVMSFTACSNQDNQKQEQQNNVSVKPQPEVNSETESKPNVENISKADNKSVDKEVMDSIIEQIKSQANDKTNKNTKITIKNKTKHLFFIQSITLNVKDKNGNESKVYIETPAEVLAPGQKTYINILPEASENKYEGIIDITYDITNVYMEYYNKSSDYTKIELDSSDVTYRGDYFIGAVENTTGNTYNNVSIFVECKDDDGFVHSYVWLNELTKVSPKEKHELELLILSVKDEVLNKINTRTKFNIKFFVENSANENLSIK